MAINKATLLPWPDRHYKKTTDQYPNMNKMLANRIHQHIKRIKYHNQVEFIPGMQGWFYM